MNRDISGVCENRRFRALLLLPSESGWVRNQSLDVTGKAYVPGKGEISLSKLSYFIKTSATSL